MGARRAGNIGRVGPYTLLERLGRGGMGEVYLASRRGRQVAVKMLRDPIEADPAARLRLDREVRALRRVESPYVARVLDADLAGDRPYLVMEYIEGETLLERVRHGGPLAGAELIVLAQGLAAALAVIHAAGVVHRDVKPANVLVGADGPVLIDFGIAQVVDATRLTATGSFLGTPGYAAPELFAGEPVREPADVHAWAATVAFAATGRPTFGRGTAEAQMYAVLHGQADLAGVPAALLPLVRAALHREPAKRPTAASLADRLARLARAAAPSEPSRGTAAAVEPPRRRPAGAAAPPAPGAGAEQAVAEAAPGERARIAERSDAAPVGAAAQSGPDKAAKAPGAEQAAADKGERPAVPAGRRPRPGAARRTPAKATVAAAGRAPAAAAAEGARRGPSASSGNIALITLALLAVPCVVGTVVWPPATFAITAAFVVLARALWSGHWLVRERRPGLERATLRVLSFPLTLLGGLLSAVVWPGIPAAAAAGFVLWLASGTRLEGEWWLDPIPVTLAGVVFGIVCGVVLGREIERAGARLPELRREGLRALAVLGGLVALCATVLRVVALFV